MSVLKPTQTAVTAPLKASGSRKSVQVNSVVTKGKIRVAPRAGLQVVAFNSSKADDTTDGATVTSQEISNSASWLQEPQISAEEPEVLHCGPEACDPLASSGPPMKLIKLVTAATVLGVAAIVLAFLQFSDSSDGVVARQTASTPSGAVVSAATAAPLAVSGSAGQDGADIVAQITAGTLAALRTGPVKSPISPTDLASKPSGQVTSAEPPNALYAMVLHAVQQGQSEYYIDQMVNEAYRAEKVAVPAVLLTASGAVDTKALLTLFVGQ